MNHSLLAAEFITIDNEVPIEHLDDDEILATMQEKEGDDEKAAEPQPNISLKLVLESVDNLFVIHQNNFFLIRRRYQFYVYWGRRFLIIK